MASTQWQVDSYARRAGPEDGDEELCSRMEGLNGKRR